MQRQVIALGNRSGDIPAKSIPSHFHPMDLVSFLAQTTTPFVSGMQRYLTFKSFPRWVAEVALFYHLVGWLIRMLRSYSGFHHGKGRVCVSLEIYWPYHEMPPLPSLILADSYTVQLGSDAGQVEYQYIGSLFSTGIKPLQKLLCVLHCVG